MMATTRRLDVLPAPTARVNLRGAFTFRWAYASFRSVASRPVDAEKTLSNTAWVSFVSMECSRTGRCSSNLIFTEGPARSEVGDLLLRMRLHMPRHPARPLPSGREVLQQVLDVISLSQAGQDGADGDPRTLQEWFPSTHLRIAHDGLVVVHEASHGSLDVQADRRRTKPLGEVIPCLERC